MMTTNTQTANGSEQKSTKTIACKSGESNQHDSGGRIGFPLTESACPRQTSLWESLDYTRVESLFPLTYSINELQIKYTGVAAICLRTSPWILVRRPMSSFTLYVAFESFPSFEFGV